MTRKYRRVIILGGPAGCGKSALIRALAQPSHVSRSQPSRHQMPVANRNGKGKAKLEIEPEGLGYEILEWQGGESDQICEHSSYEIRVKFSTSPNDE